MISPLSSRGCRIVQLLCFVWVFSIAGMAQAQSLSEGETVSAAFAQWDGVFSDVEQYLDTAAFSDDSSEALNDQLSAIRAQALEQRERVQHQIDLTQKLLDALGSRPEDGQAPESEAIAQRRAGYELRISQYREQLAQIELALVRVDELTGGLSELRTGTIVQELFSRYPLPLSGDTLLHALKEAVSHIHALLAAPVQWYSEMEPQRREQLRLWPTFVVGIFSIALGIFFRALILERYGRNPDTESPSPTLKVSAAIAEGVARGLVPLLAFVGLALWVAQHVLPLDGLFGDMLRSGFWAGVYFITFSTLAMAVLSPDKPVWRLTHISPVAARIIGYASMLLIAVIAIDDLIVESTRALAPTPSMQSVYLSIVVLIKASLIIVIALDRWWNPDEESPAATQPSAVSMMLYLRRFMLLLAVSSLIATLAGYTNLATYLIDNLIDSAVYVLLFMGLRAILLEMLAALTRSKFLRKQLGLRIISLQRIRVWCGGLITLALFVIGGLRLLLIWGVSRADLSRWIETAVTGFRVGSITVSLTDILLAICVFIAVMLVTRLFQRSLLHSILPQFTSNRSVQHSLSSGAGYVGVILAFVMFVAALGIQLESILIVAGALSVGIGFGLQNIVNNFVSGLILILERSIKVGDWVVVGENEGFVQEINFRATELETFTRASVIIPNADMLSNAVTNLTYHDKIARVEVPLQVAYGSDPDEVIAILKASAEESEDVLAHPSAFVLFTDFGADGLCFELRCYVRDGTERLSVASAIRLTILRRLTAADIEIPFPQRVVHMPSSPGAI